ncbi:MAG: efflux RND transporter periplasmic adaptor subunit [Verrucomicrobiales bacterium]|nr:efflux RND transporter periplasmic adaptor subunit [Verrucomicrobiales bacterium]
MKGLYLTLFLIFLSVPAATFAQQQAPAQLRILTYLEPYRSIEISPAESGVIRELLVTEGQTVKKGDALVKLDSKVIEARLAVATAQSENKGRILAAQSEYTLEKGRYDKLADLDTQGLSNNFELERQNANMKSSEGRLVDAQEQQRVFHLQAEQIKRELDDRILYSPINGIVSQINKDIAETVTTIEASRDNYLIQIVKIDVLKATAHIPASSVALIKIGDQLPIELDLKLRSNPSADKKTKAISGTIEFISPVIDSSSNTVRISLRIENMKHAIRGGSQAHVLIPKS